MELRKTYLEKISNRFSVNPAVALLGPRQSGKTTLAKIYTQEINREKTVHWFDLEDPSDYNALDNAKTVLNSLTGLIVIDEIQRKPDIFPILRVLIDQDRTKRQFLILGSASKDLIEQSSETLAGRLSYIEVTPFSLNEVDDHIKLWQRGGYPLAYLSKSDELALQWLKDYTASFLERDLPALGIKVSTQLMRRFWMMLTHSHGSTVNLSDIGKSLGVSHTTIRHYLDILSESFMIRELQPWFENISKRQVKSPKIYFRDSGLFHSLLGTDVGQGILHHPKLGASWEGFALEQVIRESGVDSADCYFWGIHAQNELDLLIIKNGKKLGFEFKFNDAPKVTKSIYAAKEVLGLDEATIIYPGTKSYELDAGIYLKGLDDYCKTLQI